jgi:hypothetical protein
MKTTIDARGNINWHDYILADTSLYHWYGSLNGTLGAIADTYDVNNNTDTTEWMMRMDTATTQIITNKQLFITTYLVPNG